MCFSDLIAQKVFINSFCNSQFPHKSFNVSFVVINVKKLTNLYGN